MKIGAKESVAIATLPASIEAGVASIINQSGLSQVVKAERLISGALLNLDSKQINRRPIASLLADTLALTALMAAQVLRR